jgi:hypothetical protein
MSSQLNAPRWREMALGATVVHCSENKKGSCCIDNLQKKIKRLAKNKEQLSITLLPTMEYFFSANGAGRHS